MRTKNRLLVAALVSALTLTSLTGCGNSSNGDKASSSSSSSFRRIFRCRTQRFCSDRWFNINGKVVGALGEAFMEANPDVKFTYNPTGSGSGNHSSNRGKMRYRTFKPCNLLMMKKIRDLRKQSLHTMEIAIVVNPKNKVKDLKVQQIADIYTGKIKNWKRCWRR